MPEELRDPYDGLRCRCSRHFYDPATRRMYNGPLVTPESLWLQPKL